MRSTRLLVTVLFVFILPSVVMQPTAHSPTVNAFFAPSFSMPLPPRTPAATIQAAPISGVHRVLVVAVYFSDINYTVSTDTLRQEWFGSNQSVAAYYSEISYGTFKLTGDVVGWYKLPNPEAHYGMDCKAIDDADCSGQDQSFQIAIDVVPQVENVVNFKNYDYFVFVHSGYGEESSVIKNDVWSVTYMGGVDVVTNMRTLYQLSIVAELQADGVSSRSFLPRICPSLEYSGSVQHAQWESHSRTLDTDGCGNMER